MTKPQEEFLDQMTRKMMVEWCDTQITSADAENTPLVNLLNPKMVYVLHAAQKRWVNLLGNVKDAQGTIVTIKILAPGWETASRFLKR